MAEHGELSEVLFSESESGFERPQCFCSSKRDMVGLNPESEVWACRQSIEIMQEPLNGRMVPGALAG